MHSSKVEQLPRGLVHFGCISSKSSLFIWGIIKAWVIFVLLVLFFSFVDTVYLLVFYDIGTWFFMYDRHPTASCSLLKNKSRPPYTVSTLIALSIHFCLDKFCYRARRVLLCWACCLIWMRLVQSCGVNCFLQSGHWVCLYMKVTTSVCWTFVD